jgi:anti-sigma factor RsiW
MTNETTEQLSRLADGDLTGEERTAIESHLNTSAPLRAEYRWVMFVKKAVSAKCSPKVNDEVLQVCLRRIQEVERSRRTESFVTRHAWALTGALAFVIVGGALAQRTMQRPGLGETQMASIVGGAAPVRESLDLDSRRAEDAFQKLRQSLGPVELNPVPELRPVFMEEGFLDGHSFARVLLEDEAGNRFWLVGIENRTGKLDIQGERRGSYVLGEMNGLNAVSWCEGEVAVVMAGDANTETLVSYADAVRKQR